MRNLIFILIAVVGFVFNCNRHFFLKEFPVSGDVKIEKKPKIAYVGFRTFDARMTGSSGRRTTYTAELTYAERTIPKLEKAVFIDELKSNGTRKDLSSDLVKAFAMSYLQEVKISGLKEISYLVEMEKQGETVIYKLKDYPVDYYVIGIHGPAFTEASNIGVGFLHLFSTLFSMVTIGLIPSYSSEEANTEVRVYDRNLQLINNLKYDNSYSSISSIWISANPSKCGRLECIVKKVESPQSFVYQGMGPKVEEDVLRLIEQVKK
ncbi:hypothetical protein HGB47_08980 [Leptospira yasudae]|nr:hypothetical protein [Leptospira yasudae]MBW0433748.1 hypothetical protein [Leptospira yasudae]